MTASSADEQHRVDAKVLCALLHAELSILGPWSLAMSVMSLVALLTGVCPDVGVRATGLVVLLTGVIERYLAVRLTLDRELFADLARDTPPSLPDLDRALDRLALRQALPHERPWLQRVRGTQKLVLWHVTLVLMQTTGVCLSVFLSFDR